MKSSPSMIGVVEKAATERIMLRRNYVILLPSRGIPTSGVIHWRCLPCAPHNTPPGLLSTHTNQKASEGGNSDSPHSSVRVASASSTTHASLLLLRHTGPTEVCLTLAWWAFLVRRIAPACSTRLVALSRVMLFAVLHLCVVHVVSHFRASCCS